MPILKGAKKALRVSKKKNLINRRLKSQMKTAIDQVKKEINPKNVSLASSKIDRAVKKNIIHKNKAARVKSQLAKLKSK
ncbi:MAG: 30S ribosomal protein S20 [Candidatus Pacebacteria bacterium]|nr:30S ribosomal protein S20 [Candidatus Paceibacterota bacterium]